VLVGMVFIGEIRVAGIILVGDSFHFSFFVFVDILFIILVETLSW
jgi:hypothetical protein